MTHVIGFAKEMTRGGVDWQLVIYGKAMLGFTHETATGQQTGVAYHARTDRRSATAIQTFLNELFGLKQAPVCPVKSRGADDIDRGLRGVPNPAGPQSRVPELPLASENRGSRLPQTSSYGC